MCQRRKVLRRKLCVLACFVDELLTWMLSLMGRSYKQATAEEGSTIKGIRGMLRREN